MEFLHAKSEFNERHDPHIENNEIRIGYQSETVSPSESVVDKAKEIQCRHIQPRPGEH